jgi:hyperosmotically inducible protein
MKLKSLFAMLLLAFLTTTVVPACKSKPKDADVKAKVENAISNPSVSVDVSNGVVTLSGEVSDAAQKSAAESAAKSLEKEGVVGVNNNISVVEPAPAPVEISPDAALTDAVNAAVKAYEGVKADVKDGVITLTGEIKKADLRVLMPILQALKPQKVENKLTVK